jgi:putative serine protease PepD
MQDVDPDVDPFKNPDRDPNTDPSVDPWAPPPPPSRAQAWGYPIGPVGAPSALTPVRAGLGTGGLVVLVVVTALLAGSVGGAVGYLSARDRLPSAEALRDPSADLGTGSSAVPVSRPPTSVSAIAARVLKSVVSISVDDASGSGTGSGVVLSADGFVLTNNHVVASAGSSGSIVVSFNDGRTDLRARVVGRDPETDLAVIKVVGSVRFTPAVLGSSRSLVVGDPVVAIGAPLGLSGSVTSGIVSALDRTVRVPADGTGPATPLFDAIQTDAAINPGNSGGPLVDLGGQVVGITTAIATLGGGLGDSPSGSIGVGFAIPVDQARVIAQELIRTGKATHPVIGVSVRSVGADGQGPRGAEITSVIRGGAAASAGLRVGDVIVQVAERVVLDADQLVVAVRRHRVGEAVTVAYVRDGKRRTVTLVLQDKPST